MYGVLSSDPEREAFNLSRAVCEARAEVCSGYAMKALQRLEAGCRSGIDPMHMWPPWGLPARINVMMVSRFVPTTKAWIMHTISSSCTTCYFAFSSHGGISQSSFLALHAWLGLSFLALHRLGRQPSVPFQDPVSGPNRIDSIVRCIKRHICSLTLPPAKSLPYGSRK